MSLVLFAARICSIFEDLDRHDFRIIQKVKADKKRDLVTELDLKLHATAKNYVKQHLPDYEFLSEENENASAQCERLGVGKWVVVDPLDGSSNYAAGLSNFGFMAALVEDGAATGSVIVLPEFSQYLVYEAGQLVSGYPLSVPLENGDGPVYYAYPPDQNKIEMGTREEINTIIDQRSVGLHRYGSACVGLFNLLLGKHSAFVAHKIRLWDALAYIPILNHFGIANKYRVVGDRLYLVAAYNEQFVTDAERLLMKRENIRLLASSTGLMGE